MPRNKKIHNLVKDASNLPKDKWLESYANGGETDNNIDVTKAKEYAKGWYNSPMYKSILTEQYGEKTAKNKTKQANYFSDYYNVNPTLKSDLEPYGKNIPKGNKRDILLKTKFVQNNPTLVNSLFAHELLHDDMITNKDRKKIILNTPEKELNNYITNPEEVRSQIHAIRQLGQENKVYDPFTQKFEKDYLQKIDNLFNQAVDDDKNYNQLQRLRKIYTDDQIIDMMNTISKTNTNDKVTYARFGGKVKKYQIGGETEPDFSKIGTVLPTVTIEANKSKNLNNIDLLPKPNIKGFAKDRMQAEAQLDYEKANPQIGNKRFWQRAEERLKEESEINPVTGKPTGKGALEPSYPEMALLPSSLPIKAASKLGKAAIFAAETLNPLSGFKSTSLKNIKPIKTPNVSNFNLEELRKVYHNSKRFLQPEEARYLHKHGHGLRENYLSNQLPPPPSEIEFLPDGTTRTVYNQQPITDYVSGSYRPDYIDLRRPINGHIPGTPEWNRLNDIITQSRAGNYKPKVTNKSGLSKEEAIAKASVKDKDVISKMSEEEFSNTVLKPTGEVVPYESQVDLMPHFTGNNNVSAISPKEYADRFNERLDLLNDIIVQRNKSGVEYRVKGIDEHGNLTFYTPEQTVPRNFTKKELENFKLFEKNPSEYLKNKAGLKKVNDVYVLEDGSSFESIDDAVKYVKNYLEEYKKPQKILGESTWSTGINPGEWRGNVEDIANTQYFRSIPGLEMRNTSTSVFADRTPRKGTGAYEAINEYLKKLDLGRVKPGFNSQTEFSRGAWENFIKSGRAVGFYNNPNTVYGTMKSIFPYVGTGYLGYEGLQGAGAATQQKKQKMSKGGKVTKFGLSDKFNEIFKSEYSKGGYNLDKKASKLKDSFKPKFHTVDKNVAKSKSTDFEMYMRNYQHGGRLMPTSDRPIFDLKYTNGGWLDKI
jgi:hypothetical protein